MKHTLVGHIALDKIITNDGVSYRLGGPPSYACSVSSVLDNQLDLITRIGPDFPIEYTSQFKSWGFDLEPWKCENPTTGFILDYRTSPRGLGVSAICDPLTLPDLPLDSVILSPITSELTEKQVTSLEADYVSLDPQGLIRENMVKETINLVEWRPDWLGNINLLKTSSEEHTYLTGCTDPAQSMRILARKGIETILITMGELGALVYHQGYRYTVPVYPTESVDSTGAGDCFLAAVHDKLEAGEPLEWAISYGSAVASGIVETYGPSFKLSRREMSYRAEFVLDLIQKSS